MNLYTMNLYTLVNKHTVQIIIVVHRLIDSKNKIIKNYYLDKRAQPIYAKAQPNV